MSMINLSADTNNGVQITTEEIHADDITTPQDFYDYLPTLKDNTVMITKIDTESDLYKKIEEEYGIY